MLTGLNVISGSCISKLIGRKFTSFLRLCFHCGWKHVAFTWLTCAKKCSAAEPDENIIIEGEKSIKAAEKDPSATVVACVRSAGAAAVGSVNATEFWQRRTRPPSFLPLLSCKMDRAIPQWSTLRRGSQMIYYNYRFCDNYFSSRIIHWCAVFHRKKTRTKLRLFHGCSDKIK